MKTITIMSVLMAAISMNAFAASSQCQQGSDAKASEAAASADKEKGDAVDQFKVEKADAAEKK